MPPGYNFLSRVLAFVALGVVSLVGTGLVGTGLVGTGLVGTGLVGTGLLGFGLPADASPVPALFQNPTFCVPPPQHPFGLGCHTVVEPKDWVFTGDGSGLLYKLHWTKWGAEEADGTGVFYAQTGPPSRSRCGCTRLPVWVRADYAVEYRGQYVYAIVSTGPLAPSDDQRAYQTVPDL
jgi:hypothetical protein